MLTSGRGASFRDVFSVAEFRALWTAQILSVTGDQLCRVALTVLVYDRTRSAVLAAVTFAASVIPAFIGGITLSGLADRRPRRTVMITCDAARMAMVAVMALPGIPLAGLVALLFAVTMIGSPFSAARAAVYPEILPGERYPVGTAVTLTTSQLAQVAGFAGGGVLTGLAGPRACLVADAATFAASALLVRFGVARRPAARGQTRQHGDALAGLLSGARLVLGDPAVRTPMLLGWLAAFYNAPEGIAAPLSHALGGGAATTGLVLAFPAAGYIAGVLGYSRLLDPGLQARLTGPLAIACCAVLVPVATRPGLPATLAILGLSGGLSCFQVSANAAFVTATPATQRSQAFGLAIGGMALGQGLAMIAAGAAAQHMAPATVVGSAGALGAVTAVAVVIPRAVRLFAARPHTDADN